MSLAIVYSRAKIGVSAPLVTVEVHLSNGLPAFSIVGLPEASVRESKDRVRSALINAGFEFPAKRITVNLAPADLPKEGGRFDLAIAIGILASSEQVPTQLIEQYEFYGELALSGALRGVLGVLPAALAANKANRRVIVPSQNQFELALLKEPENKIASQLLEVTAFLHGQQALETAEPHAIEVVSDLIDLQDVVGQPLAKRALEIAAAGAHNLLFIGPPGTGKTMLASRLPTILPALTFEEALEVAAVHSTSGLPVSVNNWLTPPFRSPHHSSSSVALVGGGSNPRPGDISLAHRGVLFLDEMTEFNRKVLDSLREPMESGEISISRAAGKATFPAKFQLVGALNPSPCGEVGEHSRSSTDQIIKYMSKLSGPFLDRFDLTIDVPRLPQGAIRNKTDGDSSAVVRSRVAMAREAMQSRQSCPNALLSSKQITQFCYLNKEDNEFLEMAIEKLHLSMRAYHRILKVARTIADLASCQAINRHHLSEALGYRAMDRLLKNLKG
jgi:magnesium chelatase family protein